MLSTQFENFVYKILSDKEIATCYDNTKQFKNWEYSKSFGEFFLKISQIHNLLEIPDSDNYNNYIMNGIMNNLVLNSGVKSIQGYQINNLMYLNYFTEESQKFILKIIELYDENVKINIDEINNQFETNKAKFLINYHINKMYQKLFFIWKDNNLNYSQDIISFNEIIKSQQHKFNPMQHYNYRYFTDLENMNDLNEYFENKIPIYKNIEIYKPQSFCKNLPTQNITTTSNTKKLTKFNFKELENYNVVGLKKLCKDNGIKFHSRILRSELIDLLLGI